LTFLIRREKLKSLINGPDYLIIFGEKSYILTSLSQKCKLNKNSNKKKTHKRIRKSRMVPF
jgi:hypothetical protein